MTVISGMKFSPTQGAIIADEQSSTPLRKMNIAQKLHSYEAENVSAIIGGSGPSDLLYKMTLFKGKGFDKNKADLESGFQFAQDLGNVVSRVKDDDINGFLKGKFGITYDQFQRGVNESGGKLNDQYFQQIFNTLSEYNKQMSAGFLCLTYDDKTELYIVSTENVSPTSISRPYACIGIGGDLAEPELLDFVERIPRSERDNIDPIDGLVALLHSTQRATKINQGVGGTPFIYIVNDGDIIIPDDTSIAVSGYVAKGLKGNYLPSEFCQDAISSLLLKNEGPDVAREIRKEMEKASTDRDNFIGYLLGE